MSLSVTCWTAHNLCYISLGKICGAQNWQEINYENARKCFTGSKLAHVRLILGLYPQCLSPSTKTGHKTKPEPIHHYVSTHCAVAQTPTSLYTWNFSQHVRTGEVLTGNCKITWHICVNTWCTTEESHWSVKVFTQPGETFKNNIL